MPKQTVNKRENGQFAPGNTAGNRFKPGESGNPKGRPRRTKLSEALAEQLAEAMPKQPEETIAEGVAQALIKRALLGDVAAIREIADRTEGKPRQAVDLNANLVDWRELAKANGLSLNDVLSEAQRIIESGIDSGGAFTASAEAAE